MTVLKEGAATAQMGSLLGVTTAVFLAIMVAWTLWAWAPSTRILMERGARLPLEEE